MNRLWIKLTVTAVVLGAGTYLISQSASGQQPFPDPLRSNFFQPAPLVFEQPYKPDPEMDKLRASEASAEREVAKLISEYSRTEGEARGKIKTSLTAALEKEFDLQQKRRELELSQVEARVKKVRELMQKRTEAKQTIVEKRADQLIREADGLGWTAPAANINVDPNVNLKR